MRYESMFFLGMFIGWALGFVLGFTIANPWKGKL